MGKEGVRLSSKNYLELLQHVREGSNTQEYIFREVGTRLTMIETYQYTINIQDSIRSAAAKTSTSKPRSFYIFSKTCGIKLRDFLKESFRKDVIS